MLASNARARNGRRGCVRHVDRSYLRAKPIVRPTYLSGQGRLPILPRAGWGWTWRSTLPRKGSRSAQDRAHPRAVDLGDRVRTAGDGNAAFRQVRVRRQELLRPVRCRGWKEHAARSSFNTLDATRDRGSGGLHSGGVRGQVTAGSASNVSAGNCDKPRTAPSTFALGLLRLGEART